MVRSAYEGNGMLTTQCSLDQMQDNEFFEIFSLGIDISDIRAVWLFPQPTKNWYQLMVSETIQGESPRVGII